MIIAANALSCRIHSKSVSLSPSVQAVRPDTNITHPVGMSHNHSSGSSRSSAQRTRKTHLRLRASWSCPSWLSQTPAVVLPSIRLRSTSTLVAPSRLPTRRSRPPGVVSFPAAERTACFAGAVYAKRCRCTMVRAAVCKCPLVTRDSVPADGDTPTSGRKAVSTSWCVCHIGLRGVLS